MSCHFCIIWMYERVNEMLLNSSILHIHMYVYLICKAQMKIINKHICIFICIYMYIWISIAVFMCVEWHYIFILMT